MTGNAPVSYTFDHVSVTTVKITTEAGEDTARRIADGLVSIDVRAMGDDICCNADVPDGTVIVLTCAAPRGRDYLVYAENADGEGVRVSDDGDIPEPISGATRRELAARLAVWHAVASAPSGDAEHRAAAVLVADVEALLRPR